MTMSKGDRRECDVCGRDYEPDRLDRAMNALERQACDVCADYRLEYGHWPDEQQTTL